MTFFEVGLWVTAAFSGTSLAVTTLEVWAPVINTALLIVLAILQRRSTKKHSQQNAEIAQQVKVTKNVVKGAHNDLVDALNRENFDPKTRRFLTDEKSDEGPPGELS